MNVHLHELIDRIELFSDGYSHEATGEEEGVHIRSKGGFTKEELESFTTGPRCTPAERKKLIQGVPQRELTEAEEALDAKFEAVLVGKPIEGDQFREMFEAMIDDLVERYGITRKPRMERAFCNWVIGQRATKRGRFLRVYFAGSAGYFRDIAPPLSIAGSDPDFDALLQEFKAKTKKALSSRRN